MKITSVGPQRERETKLHFDVRVASLRVRSMRTEDAYDGVGSSVTSDRKYRFTVTASDMVALLLATPPDRIPKAIAEVKGTEKANDIFKKCCRA